MVAGSFHCHKLIDSSNTITLADHRNFHSSLTSSIMDSSGLIINRERTSTHGRTLSVPSISTSEHHFHSRSSSPSPLSNPSLTPAAGSSPFSSNTYLTPNTDGYSQWRSPSPGIRPGSSAGGARSRSASTSSLVNPVNGGQKKKVVTACQRCRTRKIKCDNVLPCCGACAKSGQKCMEVDKGGEKDIPRR